MPVLVLEVSGFGWTSRRVEGGVRCRKADIAFGSEVRAVEIDHTVEFQELM